VANRNHNRQGINTWIGVRSLRASRRQCQRPTATRPMICVRSPLQSVRVLPVPSSASSSCSCASAYLDFFSKAERLLWVIRDLANNRGLLSLTTKRDGRGRRRFHQAFVRCWVNLDQIQRLLLSRLCPQLRTCLCTALSDASGQQRKSNVTERLRHVAQKPLPRRRSSRLKRQAIAL
jgi:hypothetical protein